MYVSVDMEVLLMEEWIRFLCVMSAISVSSQTVTEQMKKRFLWLRLQSKSKHNKSKHKPHSLNQAAPQSHSDEPLPEHIWDETREKNVQLLSGINGTLLAFMGQIHPLQLLGIQPLWSTIQPKELADLMDYITAGILVSYGGPWFNELLDVVRFYKTSLKNQVISKK